MKTPALILLASLAGLTVAVRALNRNPEDAAPHSQSTYYANGQVEMECAIHDGRREGTCRRFYADGRKMAEGSYAAGRMEGAWTFWLEDGNVDPVRSGHYVSGDRTED
jgi:hypothetical protein